MTGEMSWIKANGEDSNGDSYPVHAAVARRLRCKLRPFDKYIGPYIATKRGKVFLWDDGGPEGTACLWVNGEAPAYREPIMANYCPVDDVGAATAAVRQILAQAVDA